MGYAPRSVKKQAIRRFGPKQVSMMAPIKFPWGWAQPLLTMLAETKKSERGRRHKTEEIEQLAKRIKKAAKGSR